MPDTFCSGRVAEQLYLTMNLPETNQNGIFIKTLRSTDRSVVLVMMFDSSTGNYQAALKADPNSDKFISRLDVYRLKIATPVFDHDFFLDQGADELLSRSLRGAQLVSSGLDRILHVSIQDSNGKTPMELISYLPAPERDVAAPEMGKEFFIEIPKNEDVYQGRETAKAFEAEGRKQRQKMRHLRDDSSGSFFGALWDSWRRE